ncbi:MAG TPA: hypothetical protein PLL64_08160, partial [Rhodothermales bacterium]|nr:hypothetical protein [Rhodothermales bacterium]
IEEDALAKIPIVTDGKAHHVVIRMGKPIPPTSNLRNGRDHSTEQTKDNTEQVQISSLLK